MVQLHIRICRHRAVAVTSNIAYVCVIGQSERVESMKWFLLARTNKEFLTSLPII